MNSLEPPNYPHPLTRLAPNKARVHVCGMKFSSGANLKRHVQEIKGSCSINASSEDLKYEAIYMDTDDISHQSENSLLKQNDKGNLCCTICNRKFLNNKRLQNHTVKKTCLKCYACDKCGKKFHLPSRLKRHIQDIQRSCTDRLDCQNCDKIFKDRRSQYRHKKINYCNIQNQ